ncbi:hypothetical protein BAL199_15893 [alpha proteobacterium BAL199]|jgi:hypothetical protein|nr:hypothetical protein BAL199_15893 [alpha proteobacterium BAL199]
MRRVKRTDINASKPPQEWENGFATIVGGSPADDRHPTTAQTDAAPGWPDSLQAPDLKDSQGDGNPPWTRQWSAHWTPSNPDRRPAPSDQIFQGFDRAAEAMDFPRRPAGTPVKPVERRGRPVTPRRPRQPFPIRPVVAVAAIAGVAVAYFVAPVHVGTDQWSVPAVELRTFPIADPTVGPKAPGQAAALLATAGPVPEIAPPRQSTVPRLLPEETIVARSPEVVSIEPAMPRVTVPGQVPAPQVVDVPMSNPAGKPVPVASEGLPGAPLAETIAAESVASSMAADQALALSGPETASHPPVLALKPSSAEVAPLRPASVQVASLEPMAPAPSASPIVPGSLEPLNPVEHVTLRPAAPTAVEAALQRLIGQAPVGTGTPVVEQVAMAGPEQAVRPSIQYVTARDADSEGLLASVAPEAVPVGEVSRASDPVPAARTHEVPPVPKRSPLVGRIQSALLERGFDPGPVDGVQGPQTVAAVQAYQRYRGVTADGVIDAALLRSLKTAPSPRPRRTGPREGPLDGIVNALADLFGTDGIPISSVQASAGRNGPGEGR